MHDNFHRVFVRKKILWFLGFFICFFYACSSKKSQPFEKEEAFLKKFMLEEGAIYTLLGDKPVTDLLIFTGSEKDISLEGLSEKSLQEVIYVEDHTLENWIAWKEFSKDIQYKRFIFAERLCPRDPLYTMYLLINVEELEKILEKYHDEFSSRVAMSFDNKMAIQEIKDPQSLFWNRVFEDHYLSGLLHGYGEENSRYFVDMINTDHSPCFSERFQGPISQDDFPLPRYAIKSDSITTKYKEQREKIRKTYKKANFLNITLKFLKL